MCGCLPGREERWDTRDGETRERCHRRTSLHLHGQAKTRLWTPACRNLKGRSRRPALAGTRTALGFLQLQREQGQGGLTRLPTIQVCVAPGRIHGATAGLETEEPMAPLPVGPGRQGVAPLPHGRFRPDVDACSVAPKSGPEPAVPWLASHFPNWQRQRATAPPVVSRRQPDLYIQSQRNSSAPAGQLAMPYRAS